MTIYWLLSASERLRAALHGRSSDANSWVDRINKQLVEAFPDQVVLIRDFFQGYREFYGLMGTDIHSALECYRRAVADSDCQPQDRKSMHDQLLFLRPHWPAAIQTHLADSTLGELFMTSQGLQFQNGPTIACQQSPQ